MLVTSASVLSDVHRGGWAVPFPMLTSENGIFEGVLKAGINLDPRSFFRWREETTLWGADSHGLLFYNNHTTEVKRTGRMSGTD